MNPKARKMIANTSNIDLNFLLWKQAVHEYRGRQPPRQASVLMVCDYVIDCSVVGWSLAINLIWLADGSPEQMYNQQSHEDDKGHDEQEFGNTKSARGNTASAQDQSDESESQEYDSYCQPHWRSPFTARLSMSIEGGGNPVKPELCDRGFEDIFPLCYHGCGFVATTKQG